MRRRGICHLPVVDTGRLVGMLAERDVERASASSVPEIARHDWAEGLAGLVVADAMARGPLALHAHTAVAEAARLARDRGVDAFPVVDDGEVVGVVTRSELLAVLSGLLDHRHPTGSATCSPPPACVRGPREPSARRCASRPPPAPR